MSRVVITVETKGTYSSNYASVVSAYLTLSLSLTLPQDKRVSIYKLNTFECR